MAESTVRLAVRGDEEAIADVHVASWQRAYAGIFTDEFLASLDSDRRAKWWADVIDGGAPVQVADDGGVVGFCFAGSADDQGWGEIFAIYVHPSHWGLGHGHKLISAACEWLGDNGHERALLWVLEDNSRGRRFYERQGWTLGKPWRVEEIGGTQVVEVRYEIDLPIPRGSYGRDRGRPDR